MNGSAWLANMNAHRDGDPNTKWMGERMLLIETRRFVRACALTILLSLLCSCSQSNQAQAQEALHASPKPATGWRKRSVILKGYTRFTRSDTKDSDVLEVRYYQRKLLGGVSPSDWMSNRLWTGNPPQGGKWTGDPKVARMTGNMISGTRTYKSESGQKRLLTGLAVCVDKTSVRLAVVLQSENRATLKHQKSATQMLLQLMDLEKDAAKSDKRGLSLENRPPKVEGIKTGIPVKPGRYVGNRVRKGKVIATAEVVLYDSGEFEFVSDSKRRKRSGKFVYSQATGRMNMTGDFFNNNYNWNEDYCIYGLDSKRNPIIYAIEESYSGSYVWRLKWAGESELSSPAKRAIDEKMALREKNRYKFVVEPGDGVRPNEIEAVLYTLDSSFRSGGAQLESDAYLLMTDGRVMDGMPVAPDVLDVAKSRSREPDRWGWWKKEEGRYKFAWPVRPKEFKEPTGSQYVALPFKKGSRLQGDWGSASSSGMIVSGFSSVHWWGVIFTKDGRFKKRRSGSTQSGGVVGMDTLITTAYSDKGTATSVSGPGIAGGGTRKSNHPDAERMGEYEFDGYRLTLKYDDGRVVHLATFTTKDQGSIWFEGNSLSKQTRKKKKKKSK